MRHAAAVGLLIHLAIAVSARTAPAQTHPPSGPTALAGSPSQKQQIDTYERDKALGNKALAAGKRDEALKLFLSAWQSFSKDGSLACDVGRLYMARSEPIPAALWSWRCVRLLSDASSEEAFKRRRTEVVDLANAMARVVTLHIETEPGALLAIDGVDIGTAPPSEPAFVTSGKHRIEARKGSRRAAETIEGKEGETRRIRLTLRPVEPPPFEAPQPEPWSPRSAIPVSSSVKPHASRTQPRLVWWPVLVGGTLATIGVSVGVVLRVAADGAYEENLKLKNLIAREAPKIQCGNRYWGHPRCQESADLGAMYVANADASTAVFLVAGAIAAGTIAFGVYEVHRVSVTPTLGGVVGSYRW